MSSVMWCEGGADLVRLLRDTFGKDNVLVRSPHHVQVRCLASIHNVWIDSLNCVKFKLADQAGSAKVADTAADLLRAIRGFQADDSDLSTMRKALELSTLIGSAKASLPLSGLTSAVFVDAGINENRAQIGVVRVSLLADGEHVQAESHPTAAEDSTAAEQAAIEFAVQWAVDGEIIFSDNQTVVERARAMYGDRIRWLPRKSNKAADRLANVRSTTTRSQSRKRKRKRKRSRSRRHAK